MLLDRTVDQFTTWKSGPVTTTDPVAARFGINESTINSEHQRQSVMSCGFTGNRAFEAILLQQPQYINGGTRATRIFIINIGKDSN
jgi:hypothetical protein